MAEAGGQKGGGFIGGLQRLVSQVAQLGTEPDADVQFCRQMQDMLTGRIRSQHAQAGMQGRPQPGGPQPGGPAGPLMGAPGGPGPGPTPMGMNRGITPPVDELRRLLGAGSAA